MGDVLYTIDLRPVVVAQGEIPAFRDLSQGDVGPDVAQLQRLLTQLGFYTQEIDEKFGPGVRRAVRAWQHSLDVEESGMVTLGDVIFIEVLPVRVAPTEVLEVGASLSGGEVVMRQLKGDPQFAIPLAPEQRNLVPLTAEVLVFGGGAPWKARIVDAIESDTTGELMLVLESPDGDPVCRSECAERVPLEGTSNFPAEIIVVPETSGPVVPVSALLTGPDGAVTVRKPDGSAVTVSVVAAADGLAVVNGIEEGDVIALPIEEPSS